jgi:hypothetical protein
LERDAVRNEPCLNGEVFLKAVYIIVPDGVRNIQFHKEYSQKYDDGVQYEYASEDSLSHGYPVRKIYHKRRIKYTADSVLEEAEIWSIHEERGS